MKTEQLFLDDSYAQAMNADVLEVTPESSGRWRVRLDRTVFYPMGGGQPTDQGTLTADGWVGDVYQVLNKDGEIWHYASSAVAPPVGLQVHGQIDWERRYRNMRLHSGGHIVDFAMYLLGYSPEPLMPLKGDHGKKPFIIYQGTIAEDIRRQLEARANELVQQDLQFSWRFQPVEELQNEAIYLQPGLPAHKPLRTLHLAGVGSVADGGTQVHSTAEVGPITIKSIDIKDGNTIVAYTLTQ